MPDAVRPQFLVVEHRIQLAVELRAARIEREAERIVHHSEPFHMEKRTFLRAENAFDQHLHRILRRDFQHQPDPFVKHRRVLVAVRHAPAVDDDPIRAEGRGIFTVLFEQGQRRGKRQLIRVGKQVADVLVRVKGGDADAARPTGAQPFGNARIRVVRVAEHHKFKPVAVKRVIMLSEHSEIETVPPAENRAGRQINLVQPKNPPYPPHFTIHFLPRQDLGFDKPAGLWYDKRIGSPNSARTPFGKASRPARAVIPHTTKADLRQKASGGEHARERSGGAVRLQSGTRTL